MPDTWSEVALLTITKKSETDVDYMSIISNFSISGGEKGFESIATISGGRLKQFKPQEDFEVTIEGYAIEMGTSSGSTGKGFADLMYGGPLLDTSQPISFPSTGNVMRSRDEYRIVILWTDDNTIASAVSSVGVNQYGKRLILKNGHFTKCDFDFSDKVLKYSITFRCPPLDKDGNPNVTYESTDGTATLDAVSSYT